MILLEDEAAYEESLESDMNRIRLHANGQDQIYFSKNFILAKSSGGARC
jgi:predicted Rossmann fold nucleotide-binding protein DprA/Smf involved in DNA uptake